MTFFKAFSLFLFFAACKSDPVIDYATAYDKSPIDTHRMTTPGGIQEFYTRSYSSLIGAQLPEFSSTTLDGKQINQSYFEGKVTVINFWFIGCKPCEEEMPLFNQFVEKYADEDINFLAIGRNEAADIEEFLITTPFNFDHINNGEQIIEEVFRVVWGYPTTFVVDKKMKIIHIGKGLGDLTKVTESQKEFVEVIENALAKN